MYARDNDIPVILFPKSEDEPNGLSPNDVVAALRLDFSLQNFSLLFAPLTGHEFIVSILNHG